MLQQGKPAFYLFDNSLFYGNIFILTECCLCAGSYKCFKYNGRVEFGSSYIKFTFITFYINNLYDIENCICYKYCEFLDIYCHKLIIPSEN